ncbi:unnamed protein product, partial [Rotaria socialis]
SYYHSNSDTLDKAIINGFILDFHDLFHSKLALTWTQPNERGDVSLIDHTCIHIITYAELQDHVSLILFSLKYGTQAYEQNAKHYIATAYYVFKFSQNKYLLMQLLLHFIGKV